MTRWEPTLHDPDKKNCLLHKPVGCVLPLVFHRAMSEPLRPVPDFDFSPAILMACSHMVAPAIEVYPRQPSVHMFYLITQRQTKNFKTLFFCFCNARSTHAISTQPAPLPKIRFTFLTLALYIRILLEHHSAFICYPTPQTQPIRFYRTPTEHHTSTNQKNKSSRSSWQRKCFCHEPTPSTPIGPAHSKPKAPKITLRNFAKFHHSISESLESLIAHPLAI